MPTALNSLIESIGSMVLGKHIQIKLALSCLLAGGHLLIEDIPGIGKTLLAKTLARHLGLSFKRLQFTSDLLPSDVLGFSVFSREKNAFVFHNGPIFTQVLLADEINRSTPKTQSALLEAMEENQVSTEGVTRPLSKPFFVIATQNPREQSGTYPLPESQLDRFLMRISLGYPDTEAELQILKRPIDLLELNSITPKLSPEEVLHWQKAATETHIADELVVYVQRLLAASRNASDFFSGLSPRAGIGLIRAAKTWSVLDDRLFVLPEDVQAVFPWVAGHRLRMKAGGREIPSERLQELVQSVPIP